MMFCATAKSTVSASTNIVAKLASARETVQLGERACLFLPRALSSRSADRGVVPAARWGFIFAELQFRAGGKNRRLRWFAFNMPIRSLRRNQVQPVGRSGKHPSITTAGIFTALGALDGGSVRPG